MTFSARLVGLTAAVVLTAGLGFGGAAEAAGRGFGNCDQLHAVYPAGVAKSAFAATHPVPSWARIGTPVVDAATYAANKRLDRDGDGIACEVGR